MPAIPPIRRVLFTVAVTATVALWLAPAPALASAGSIRTIDAQTQRAQRAVLHWQHVLARWQVRIGRAEATVQRLTYASPAALRAPDDAFRHGMARAPRRADPLARAHRRLQRALRDHRAQEAFQQIAAWNAYLGQLQRERARAEAAARRAQPGATASVRPSGPLTYEAWGRSFLKALGAPACSENVLLVVAWETQESTAASFNPLATTHVMNGASSMNDVGVENYVSFAQGIQASRDTLLGGSETTGYAAIVEALRACDTADATAAAVRDSAWCRGCGGGTYLVALVPVVRAAYDEHAARLVSTAAA